MAQPESTVQQCLLDRLVDLDPQRSEEAPLTRAQSVRGLKAALKRDLEWLLNTRRTVESAPEAYREVHASLFVYGLPDINSVGLNSPQDEKRLLRAMESALTLFEPRLTRVKVTPRQPLRKTCHSLGFQIEGLLMLDPVPEMISFDTVLDVSRGEYQVKGE